jgi:hypothetical protein
MDLAVRDIRTHARPYGFDFLMRDRATRLSPLYSLAFTRAGELEGGKSHGIYAAWFDEERRSWSGRIFSLGPNHPVFDSRKIPGPEEKGRSPAGGFAAGGPAAAFAFDGSPAGNGRGGTRGALPPGAAFPGGILPGAEAPACLRQNSPADRAAGAAEILVKALRDPALAAPLMGELAPLLFPGKNGMSREKAATELTAMARRGREK